MDGTHGAHTGREAPERAESAEGGGRSVDGAHGAHTGREAPERTESAGGGSVSHRETLTYGEGEQNHDLQQMENSV